MSELKQLFSFTFAQKLLKIFSAFFGWVVIVVSLGLYFVSQMWYRRLTKYMLDNNRNKMKGIWLLTLQMGFKNILFGFLHSVMRHLPY